MVRSMAGRTRFSIRAHQAGTGGVVALAISRDGELLQRARAFSSRSCVFGMRPQGEASGTLPRTGFGASALAFSSAYPLLAIAGRDGCAAACGISERLVSAARSKHPGRALDSVVFSKDGKRFATGGMDATAPRLGH